MKRIIQILSCAAALLALPSCEWISGIIHDDQVVARVDGNKLYRSQLRSFIPSGISEQDSLNLALRYVNTWAVENLTVDMASQMLSKEEMDVTKELEDYRRSLIKYRYEQHFVNSKLDTLVTDSQIEEYFLAHEKSFVLTTPIVRARFLDVMKASPNLDAMRELMSSDDERDCEIVDSLAYSSAIRYVDHSDRWESVTELARLFGRDYHELLPRKDRHNYIEVELESGEVRLAYICEMYAEGQVPPVEYVSEGIKDLIIGNRKRALLSGLERSLLEDALENGNLIIY